LDVDVAVNSRTMSHDVVVGTSTHNNADVAESVETTRLPYTSSIASTLTHSSDDTSDQPRDDGPPCSTTGSDWSARLRTGADWSTELRTGSDWSSDHGGLQNGRVESSCRGVVSSSRDAVRTVYDQFRPTQTAATSAGVGMIQHTLQLQQSQAAAAAAINNMGHSQAATPAAASTGQADMSQRQLDAENFVAEWTTGGSDLSVLSTQKCLEQQQQQPPLPPSDDGWYYCDPQGQIQGHPSSVLCLYQI